MKTNHFISFVFLLIVFFACKKEIPATELTGNNVINSVQTNGPVKMPRIVLASTTRTQFVANADGKGTADLTLSFAAKHPGIAIVSFWFLAYETDSADALSITSPIGKPFFKATNQYPPAKAIAYNVYGGSPDSPIFSLSDDGSPVLVTFTIHYNIPSSIGHAKSGDTISVKLIGIEGIDSSDMDPQFFEDLESPLSPQIMLTGSKPFLGLNVFDPDVLHIGLTRIFETEYDSQGGSLGINNLPLVITTTGDVKFKKELIVKDEYNNTVNVTTSKHGSNYTIQFPEGYMLNGVNVHDFFVYAHVTEINGQASIDTYLQPPAKFSWTDIAGGRTIPYAVENATYYKNYPNDFVTSTHN